MAKPKDPILEKFAELEHNQWIFWTKSLAKVEKISPERLKRWKKLWKTPYAKLTELQKEDDRVHARKVLNVVVRMSINGMP